MQHNTSQHQKNKEEVIRTQIMEMKEAMGKLFQELEECEENSLSSKSEMVQKHQRSTSSTIQMGNPSSKQFDSNENMKSERFSTYVKRKGTSDSGKEYEYMMCALYALKLIQDDEVLDFEMTTNNAEHGDFDDIGLKVKFADEKWNTYLFQLKHKENPKLITRQDLNNSKSKQYCLEKYFESMSTIKDKSAICILYTNCLMDIKEVMQLEDVITAECNHFEHEHLLLNTSKRDSNTVSHFKQICSDKSVYFFTNQKNLYKVKHTVIQMLYDLLKCDIYDSFNQYIKKWWSESIVLTKHDFITKLTEMALSPYIKTLCELTIPCEERPKRKIENLKKAIAKFDMIIIKNCDEELINSIWLSELSLSEDDVAYCKKAFGFNAADSLNMRKSKMLWYLDKVPLIIKVDNTNAALIKCVTKLMLKGVVKKFVCLSEKILKKEDFEDWHVFETVSDLIENGKEDDFYRLIEDFNVSLQGRECVSLSHLINMDKTFAEIIGAAELFKMAKEEFIVIGHRREELPNLHIPRILTTSLVSIKDVFNDSDITIIINCDEIFKKKLVDAIEISKYILRESEKTNQENNKIIVSTESKCTINQFDQVCQISKTSSVCLFQVFDGEYWRLLLKKGNTPHFDNKDNIRIIKESEIFNKVDSLLNVFCAPPGMGKSRLMEVLKVNCPSEFWATHIDLINYNSLFAKKPNFEEIRSCFLECDKIDKLTKQVSNVLCKNNRMHLFLDGLDEVNSEYVDLIFDFAKRISSQGVNVWISTRENLRERIYQGLYAVPIEIKELAKTQQKEYIHDKLKHKYGTREIDTIVSSVYKSAEINNSQELLGVPLQLHILTEMFLNNDQVYRNLKEKNIYILTEMYKVFFEGKIKSTYDKILSAHLVHQLGIVTFVLEMYEIPALKAVLDASDFDKLNLKADKIKNVEDEIKNNGDKHGIIKKINDREEVIFEHQTFAEYFACAWFTKHKEKMGYLRDTIFSQRYENLRRIFDIMLAEDNPLHLAVIFKNIEQFNENYCDLSKKDEGGRTVLHLACCLGNKYPSKYSPLHQECDFYVKITKKLFEGDINIYDSDTLFNFNCINYSVESRCLYPIQKMLEEKLAKFEDIFDELVKHYDTKTLAYYAAELGYPDLLSDIIKVDPDSVECELQEYQELTLLQTAVLGNRIDVSMISKEGNIAVVEILLKNDRIKREFRRYSYRNILYTILDFACINKCYDMLELLINNGVACSRGNTILHVMLDRELCNELSYQTTAYTMIDEEEIINFAINFNINVNKKNDFGETALHLACKFNKIKFVKMLLDIHAGNYNGDSDQNKRGNTSSQVNMNDISDNNQLRSYILDLNAQNKDGRTALQLACLMGCVENVKILLEKEADPYICDFKNRNALHFACESMKPNTEMIILLISQGINLNCQNNCGTTPLHLACKTGCVENINLLLQRGADSNICDINNRSVLHFACESNQPNLQAINLLIKHGLNVNSQDIKGSTPLHSADQRGLGCVESVKLLLEKGADPNVCNINDRNLLHLICTRRPNAEMLNLLISYGLNFNAQDKHGITPLQLACKSGWIKTVKLLVEKGGDVNICDNRNRNALYFACESYGSQTDEIINLLINNGLNVNSQDIEGITPLHFACQSGRYAMVRLLLAKGADANICDTNKCNALHFAFKQIHLDSDIVNELLIHGCNVNFQDKDGTTPLHLASLSNVFKNVRLLLENGADVNMCDSNNRNALHFACNCVYYSNVNTINLLITHGINTNCQDKDGITPLQLACKSGWIKTVKLLVEKGGDVNICDNRNRNALYFACESYGSQTDEIINLLINNGLNVNSQDIEGITPLHFACQSGRYAMVRLLLAKGADANICYTNKCNALHFAFKQIHLDSDIVNELLIHGCNVNSQDKDGTTPLHLASLSNVFKNVRLLLENGADVNMCDSNNRNALHFACNCVYYSNVNTINLLITHGINPNCQDKDGITPLHLECKFGRAKNVKFLLEEGADENTCDKDNCNALDYAYKSEVSNEQVIDMLVNCSLSPNTQDKQQLNSLN